MEKPVNCNISIKEFCISALTEQINCVSVYTSKESLYFSGGGTVQVYKKVRAYIDEHGLKQTAIAQKAGISKVTFNAMMNGKRRMYADDLRAICLALNVSPELFMEVPSKG